MHKITKIKVIIIEDNIDLRNRLCHLMKQSTQLECTHVFSSVEGILRSSFIEVQPDIILLDIGLPGISGIDGIPKIKQVFPKVEIVILTVYNDPDKIFEAICAGATGYLLKDINFDFLESQLIGIYEKGGAAFSPQVARRVLNYFQKGQVRKSQGKVKLNNKEHLIIRGLIDGLSYQRIAETLGITIDGVRYHIKNIYKTLQVNSKTQAIKKYLDGSIE